MSLLRIIVVCTAILFGTVATFVRAADEEGQRSPPMISTGSQATDGDEVTPPPAMSASAPVALGVARVLYFVPSDHDMSTTCLFFMNETAAQQTVQLQGFSSTGVASGTWTVTVPASTTARACSDSIAAGAPPSWAGATIVNFTDFT